MSYVAFVSLEHVGCSRWFIGRGPGWGGALRRPMVSLHDADEVLVVDAEDETGLLPPVLNVCGIFAAELECYALQGVGETVAGVSHLSFFFLALAHATIARQSSYYRSCPIDLETCRCLVAIPRLTAGGKKLVGYRSSLSLFRQCRGLQQWARLSSLLSLLE